MASLIQSLALSEGYCGVWAEVKGMAIRGEDSRLSKPLTTDPNQSGCRKGNRKQDRRSNLGRECDKIWSEVRKSWQGYDEVMKFLAIDNVPI